MFPEIVINTDEKLICESCGQKFSCGSNVGKCWCFAVELKEETLMQLKDDFKNCLCEMCLEQMSKGKIQNK